MRIETGSGGLALLVLLSSLGAAAAEEEAPNEMPAGSSITRKPAPGPRLPTREGYLLAPGEQVDASEALDEMLDELGADLARLGAAKVSPLLLERVRVSDNMNPEFAHVLEARITSAIFRAANVTVVRCIECWATRSRVEDGAWVVTRGVSRKEELEEIAERYDAQAYLSATLTLHTFPSSLALDVEVVRASDAAILFAEGYRIHPHTAMLYRGADTAQSREAKLKDLEARIDARPQFGHGAVFGAMMVPSDHYDGPIWGAVGGYRLYEKFGQERQWRLGIAVGGFLNTSRLAGALLSATLLRRVTKDNLYSPSFFIGGSAGAFITGSAGNSPILTLQGEYLMGHRIAVQASLSYLFPFRLGSEFGPSVGGVCPQVGVAFIW